jgi:uncharacterized protein (DUF362 family)
MYTTSALDVIQLSRSIRSHVTNPTESGLTRRRLISSLAAGTAATFLARRAQAVHAQSAAPYHVGIATGFTASATDGYAAAQAAIASLPAGEFPNVSGLPVVIKVNLVLQKLYTTGTTTDPNVCQAVVDLCIQNGATQIYIVEAAQISSTGQQNAAPPFAYCGYTAMFASYPNVTLVDLDKDPETLTPVLNGYVYQNIWLAQTLLTPNAVFISCSAMKTHTWASVTLTCKNYFGLFLPTQYFVIGQLPRSNPHELSVAAAVTDIHRIVPVHFAVVAGIYGMQGNGPIYGSPVNAGVVLAGKNPVAVDRIGMQMMLGTYHATHLDLMAAAGMGPSAEQVARQVVTYGAAPLSLNFLGPNMLWPYSGMPKLSASSVSVGAGLTITYKWPQAANGRVEIVQDNESLDERQVGPTERVTQIKLISDWAPYTTNELSTFTWDGTTNSGSPAGPGTYLVRISAGFNANDSTPQSSLNFGSKLFQVIS